MKKYLFMLFGFLFLAAGCKQAPAADSGLPNVPANQNASVLAIISVTGSTNTKPFSIEIFTDGSATASVQGAPDKNFISGTVDATTLSRMLSKIGDVSKIDPKFLSGYYEYQCAKSASFGVAETISYLGKTSGDLTCTWPNQALPTDFKNLADIVNLIVNQLQLNTERH